MARSLGFFYDGKYLCAFGLQFQVELGTSNDDRNECSIDYRGVKNEACKRLKRLQANGLAESEGFEPSCDFTRNSISSRARYDHFDNSPCYISTQLLKSQPWKMERKVGEKTV